MSGRVGTGEGAVGRAGTAPSQITPGHGEVLRWALSLQFRTLLSPPLHESQEGREEAGGAFRPDLGHQPESWAGPGGECPKPSMFIRLPV